MNTTPARPETEIDPATHMGPVALTVADLDRATQFYTNVLGMHVQQRQGQTAVLGAGARPLLRLVALPGARPHPARATGLYHFAVLVPDRRELARALQRLAGARYPLDGVADHLVSEALYLSDPDGNGIEIYRDRPRADWPRTNGQIRMATDPLDLQDLIGEIRDDHAPDAGLPADTQMGHVHLQVADLQAAAAFYEDALGFGRIVGLPGALFVSAGGYHHHLGLNTWQSRGGPRPPDGSAGLRYFVIEVPNAPALQRVADRLAAAAFPFTSEPGAVSTRDPWGTGVRLVAGSSAAASLPESLPDLPEG